MLTARKSYLSREKMLAFLGELEATDSTATSLYLPAGLSPEEISELVEKVDPDNATPGVADLAISSPTGTVIFWSQTQKYVVLPPLPVSEERFHHGFIAAPLASLLSHDYRIGVVLVRLGSYAVGFCRGENLVASKVGTGNIHARHRQGGSSARRFQRHREKQIESFLIRVCGHIEEILRPQAKSLDYVVYGGAQTTILLLQKRCPFLQQFADRSLPPLLDIADPRQPVLEKTIGRIWSSTVIEWSENEQTAPG
ncbi:MAG: Vms1/Ankzf1 family peptidyl-tRNA hydrolase [Chloroflexota bacterium]